ncbi:MAG: 1,4-alpha-glucan branching protein GlgB [Limimaricola soesokkakensis]|uniref:1,4-alpha-glucan branching protein GlgB n=1 Tax=Limimaricola soesokkakensis TaxID=1343159 RepID=UPI004058A563
MTTHASDTLPASAPDATRIEAIIRGRMGDPFELLGPHKTKEGVMGLTVFAPDAAEVVAITPEGSEIAPLSRINPEGVFWGQMPGGFDFGTPYRLRMKAGSHEWERDDPYRFTPVLGEMDEYLVAEGRHEEIWKRLGAHPVTHEGVEGVSFAVWAPNARRVSVVGHFNAWDGRRHPLRRRFGAGLWELFVPNLAVGDLYKFEIVGAHGDLQPLKADPMSFRQEQPPSTGSIVHGMHRHEWQDAAWMESRSKDTLHDKPVSIYEVHLGSWRRGAEGEILDYDTIGGLLVDYLQDMNFTHVEFMPVSEHPFTGSWGYQPVGLFAPTSRYGTPEQFAAMVDRLHQAGIGVIVDWVPAHFPTDAHGLANFDGTALYEHADPRQGFHQDWNTLIYNFGRNEVANFLRCSGTFWLDKYHIDALRVDAVASMLYLDYSRNEGEWIPNQYGGRENLDAIEFLKGTNHQVQLRTPGAATIAEESTAFPGVSRPVDQGGLGFDFKWNMGWMHDSLSYIQNDPVYRKYNHHQMTFSIHYAWSENFVLPISHDEVVHGKGSLLNKMPGDRWQKFANLRAYLGFMWTHPGKKLLFMGCEFGQEREWNHDVSLDWHLLEDEKHKGAQNLVRDLNRLYRDEPALHALDCDPAGFEWVDGGDNERSIFAFLRKADSGTRPALIISNMTPVVREDYRIGVPEGGDWTELLNTDAEIYGGSGVGNSGRIACRQEECHGRSVSLALTLPPLATIILVPDR